MIPTRKSLIVLAAIVVMVGCQHVAQADPLVLSLQNNSLAGVAGGSVTFVGSVTNTGTTNTNPATINSLSISNAGSLGVNGIPFITNFTGQTVANGATLGPLPLVTFNIPVGTLDGSYSGSFQILYDTATGELGSNTVQWTIRVGSGPAPVPEPTTIALLQWGLLE